MDRNETSRRRFLAGIGLGGIALSVGLPGAVAQEEDGPAEGESEGDESTAALLETLELAAAAFYDDVVRSGKVQSPAALAMLADFGRHHREHADRFGALAGDASVGEPNRRLVQIFTDQLEQKQSEAEVLEVSFDLETAMSSTYLSQLPDLTEAATVELVTSVLPVESQHATAVARTAGLGLSRAVPQLENLDLALDVTQFPATTTTTTA